jgi:hypothetical protein
VGEHELIFDAKEMRVIEVVCPKCGGGVVFDAANESQSPPSRCPSCESGGNDPEMSSWLGGYRKWYQAIVGSQKKFRFRVPIKHE